MWMGVYPESFLRPIRADVGRVVARLQPVVPSGDSLPTPGHGAAPQAALQGAH